MSITSSNQKQVYSHFFDLLTHYPRLAAWLADILQSRAELQAEAILPSFLLECASQGVPGNAYPFTAEDHGLADLRIFLRNAQAELKALVEPSSLSTSGVPAAPQLAFDDVDATPVARRRDERPGAGDAPSTDGEAPGEPDNGVTSLIERETASSPGVETDLHAQDADLDGGITEKIPVIRVSSRDVVAEANREGADGADKAEIDVAEKATESMPLVAAPALEGSGQATEPISPAAERVLAEPDAVAGDAGVEEAATQPISAVVRAPDTSRPAGQRRRVQLRRPRTRRERLVSLALLALILGAILVPVGFFVGFGVSVYTTYHALSDQAHSAVNHLLNVKNIFGGNTSHLNGIFDVAKLQRAEREFTASGRDFQQLQDQLQNSSTLSTVVAYLPQYRETLKSAQAASAVGIDIARIGQIAATNAVQLAPSLSGPLLSVSKKPLITQPMLDTISATLGEVLPLLGDMQAHAQDISLDSLPISLSEKAQVGPLLQHLPQTVNDLGQVRNLLGAAGWLLGVNHPRTFLVQTMDRAELRGTGGFTGQYGELTINGGRVAPFSLKDIADVEYTAHSANQGQLAPIQYRSWWPFPNWGLRDSNISADFPTSAQVALQLYQQEVGNSVDGVISFTPMVIEHILAVIGPLSVPGYNTTVTAQNLEDVLHYYQLNNSGITRQIFQQPNDSTTSARKRFTSLLASLLMNKVRGASPDALLSIAHQVLYDLKSRDLQVYFTDPTAENLLKQRGYAGQMDRSPTHDGLYVVQENLSASKASQYVQTIMHDNVTLDDKGGATHTLQIRLVYNQAGPVYGYDTYYDYLRVYVPPTSVLIWGDGFATDTPLCGGHYGSCPADGAYPHGELNCPSGQYQPGASPPTFSDPSGATWQPLRVLGGPTNTTSDEPGRAMYGGWVIVPKNCTMNVTLRWYVPPVGPYSLLVQRQAGTFPELDLTVLPDAANCVQLRTAGLHFDGILTQDSSFAPTISQGSQSCYPAQGV